MEIADLINSITSFGFPIVVCIIMFTWMENNDDKRELDSKEMREAINNNTQVLNQLVDKIHYLRKKG